MQTAVAVVAGLGFLIRDVPSAVGALAGGLLVAVGTGVLALRVFAPALAGAGVTLARFAVGTLLKWVVVLGGLYVFFAWWRLPALPVVVGLAAAALVNLVMFRVKP